MYECFDYDNEYWNDIEIDGRDEYQTAVEHTTQECGNVLCPPIKDKSENCSSCEENTGLLKSRTNNFVGNSSQIENSSEIVETESPKSTISFSSNHAVSEELKSCLSFVWSKNIISNIRSFFNVRDYISNRFIDKYVVTIGSMAEGLLEPDCNIDILFIIQWISVEFRESGRSNHCHSVLYIEEDISYPGYALLRVHSGFDYELINKCSVRKTETYLSSINKCSVRKTETYLSSHLFQLYMADQCEAQRLSDIEPDESDSLLTCKFALRSSSNTKILNSFPRKQKQWPSKELILKIKKDGFLLLPQGHPSSTQRELHWQYVFITAEKSLIRSLSHEQLLVFALLKIYIRENMSDTPEIRKFLSISYLIKTVMFWVLEESDCSIWTVSNFFQNFILAFGKLAQFISSENIPNYFIPEQNLLAVVNVKTLSIIKSKIKGLQPNEKELCGLIVRRINANSVYNLHSKEIGLVRCADTFIQSFLPLLQVECSSVNFRQFLPRTVSTLLSTTSHFERSLYCYLLAQQCQTAGQQITPSSGNKAAYKHLRLRESLLLMGSNTDSMSGWILIAGHFLTSKRYHMCKLVLNHLQDILKERSFLMTGIKTYSLEQIDTYRISTKVNKMSFLTKMKRLFAQPVMVPEEGTLISKDICAPKDKDLYLIPPEILIYYLKFLCELESGMISMCPEILIHAQDAVSFSLRTKEMQTLSRNILQHMEDILHRHF